MCGIIVKIKNKASRFNKFWCFFFFFYGILSIKQKNAIFYCPLRISNIFYFNPLTSPKKTKFSAKFGQPQVPKFLTKILNYTNIVHVKINVNICTCTPFCFVHFPKNRGSYFRIDYTGIMACGNFLQAPWHGVLVKITDGNQCNPSSMLFSTSGRLLNRIYPRNNVRVRSFAGS